MAILRERDPDRAPAESRPSSHRPPLELMVFVVGTSTLGAEIAAARLMAPYFGASTIVWANTIAIVLVALSIGYWFGGRLADRHPHMRGLCLLVLVAAVLLAVVPIVADPFLSLSVEAFDSYSVGAFAGSLFGVLALVALPVLMLGAVSPWAIRLKLDRVEDSGQTAGRMYAISTVGSLLGTFLSALLLIPLVGTQRTFLTFAIALAIVAALGLGRRYLVVPVLVAALALLPPGTVKAAEQGRVIHEADTEYQYARVVEYPDGERHLELNEGQAVHSIYRPDSVLTDNVWDGYLIEPFAVLSEPPERIAILGTAGGTTARAYEKYFPETRIDAVEIDGELFDIAEDYFDLHDRPQLERHAEDARPFLRRTDARYDAIFVDAYRQPYIPFYLTTREFFELARDRLNPGGVVIVNVGHPESSDRLEKVLSATVAEVFPNQLRDPIARVNTLLVASEQPVTRAKLERAATTLPADLRPLAAAAAARVGPRLRGGEVYTDDLAPVEWLIDKSIVEYAAQGDPQE
ncbi:MAG: Spermidine synthase [uncultured Solirubrobacteraceae bacterium]|uniref:Spermidine synthase n=1 Tax=uncultured Solirubrobacteraceae bacterium TaxID=1162706 RepID=A0A6J4S0I1_9ACTN|nr:MAG: Spermidine synthase [uncultured Solirubrobacteraceae bacterium]